MKLLSMLRRGVASLSLWSLPAGETRPAASRRLFINGKLITLPALPGPR